MKRSVVFALLVLLSCAPAFARSTKNQFKVKVKEFSWSFQANAGDSLRLTLKEDSVEVFGKTCPRAMVRSTRGFLECPVCEEIVSAQFPPSAIRGVVQGQNANFVSIILNVDGKKAILAFEPSGRDSSLIVGFLEKATGKKSVNVDTQSA
ncbi:MAG: hypothetical protein WCD70_09115, partial [Alphaproteobacteria bacterium]